MKYILFGVVAFLLGVLVTVPDSHLKSKEPGDKE